MKKLILISLFIISNRVHSQIDWSNYSTSFTGDDKNKPTLGIAVPYNGIYDNFNRNVVGISQWNPSYQLHIDTALDENIPLFFVYDTSGIYFLLPGINKNNAIGFEFTVLLNNKTIITPWSPVNQFTKKGIGNMNAGSGITGSYHANISEYLVAYLRNRQGKIISSIVIYFQKATPKIKLLNTADNAQAFSKLVNNHDYFADYEQEIGWHRQYANNLYNNKDTLHLSYNENNILITLDSKIYKKEAVEYALFKKDKMIKDWAGNEFDTHYILLKNLDPGIYTIKIRYKRQRNSIASLHFLISSAWYKTAAFKAAILILFLLLIALSLLFIKYRSQKQNLYAANNKAEQSARELKNIHALLNPHFTFNALSSIQSLINKGNIEAANNYLSAFRELLIETLNESTTELIPLSKELDNLKTYINLEQLRNTFTYNIHVDDSINLQLATIPPFMLQPFAENAIKHSLSQMNGMGTLNIFINRDKENMVIEIIDNGAGFDPSTANYGHGLNLSKKRIALLNDEYKEELIKLQIKSTAERTTILISFQNWL